MPFKGGNPRPDAGVAFEKQRLIALLHDIHVPGQKRSTGAPRIQL
jgi:hypothetical protein